MVNPFPHADRRINDYLDRCEGSTYDWTSASDGVRPPPEIEVRAASSFLGGLDNTEALHHGKKTFFVREAASEYFKRCGISSCSTENIFVAPNSFEIISEIYDKLCWPQHKTKVLIPTPTFGHFFKQCQNHGMQAVALPLNEKTGWKLTPRRLETALVAHKPDIFLLVNPANPTGVIYTKEELEALATVLKRHNVLTIADEVYREIILNHNRRPYSLAAIKGMEDKVITLNGIGKSMGFPSTYISFCHAPEPMARALTKTYEINGERQARAVFALRSKKIMGDYFHDNAMFYLENIILIKDQLEQLNKELHKQFGRDKPYVKPLIDLPEATNLYLLRFDGLRGKIYDGKPLQTGLDVAEFLQKEAGIAMVPGEAFDMDAQSMVVRLVLSHTPQEFEKGFHTIAEACKKLTAPPRHAPSPRHNNKSLQ